MSTVPLTMVNLSPNELIVTGYAGTDLSDFVPLPALLPSLKSLEVCQFTWPGSGDRNYDWLYLKDAVTNLEFQAYIEVNRMNGNDYAYLGYKDPESTESNSNPSPFPDDPPLYYTIDWEGGTAGPVYYLLMTPPPEPNPNTANPSATYWVTHSQGRPTG